ncbi:MAG: D-alanyl-D-alanine carboxypeptidase [Actinomycetes bacterium]
MKLRLRAVAIIGVLSFSLSITTPSYGEMLPANFISLSEAPALNRPGILLIDPKSNETLFSSEPDVVRAPASVLKLVSTTSALKTFGAEKTFTTSISQTEKPNKFLLVGGGDPWLTTNKLEAEKYKRAFLPYLINKAIEKNPQIKAISLQYKNIYFQDIQAIQRYYKGRIKIYPHAVSDSGAVESPLAQVVSPKLSEIINFTLLWSDNLLAARLSLMAAKANGFPADSAGLQASFEKLFTEFNIAAPGLVIKDGAGLSHETRISARTLVELLVKIKSDPSLQVIYDGLPLSGVSGTLRHRFTKDAPSAVGLVKAKTGWINTTVSLAGFVNVGESDYVFAVIADRIINKESARQSARIAIDKMLATIARPAPSPTKAETSTAIAAVITNN